MRPEDDRDNEEKDELDKPESVSEADPGTNPEQQPASQAESGQPAAKAESAEQADDSVEDGEAAAEAQDTGDAEEEESETARMTRELEAAKQLAEENYDKFVRFQAEMENYRKRVQKERVEDRKYAHLPVMRDLMEIVDNLERAMEHARNNSGEGVDGIVAGVEMVAKQLNETFERHGMKRIKSVGEQFDPTMHEAMGLVETDSAPENQVMEEYEAGYFLHERVVKPAKVMVSKKPSQAPPAQESPQEL